MPQKLIKTQTNTKLIRKGIYLLYICLSNRDPRLKVQVKSAIVKNDTTNRETLDFPLSLVRHTKAVKSTK